MLFRNQKEQYGSQLRFNMKNKCGNEKKRESYYLKFGIAMGMMTLSLERESSANHAKSMLRFIVAHITYYIAFECNFFIISKCEQ